LLFLFLTPLHSNSRYIDNSTTNRLALANTMGFEESNKENVPPPLAAAFERPAPRLPAHPGYPVGVPHWAAAAASSMTYPLVPVPAPSAVAQQVAHQVALMPVAAPAPPVIPRDRDPSLVIDFGRARERASSSSSSSSSANV
jgi:hypothetical protein